MNDDLDLNLNQQFETLPKELQAAISAVDLPEKLQQIIKNNKVMIDKAEGVQMETLMVLLGLEPVDDYMGNLVKNVGLEKTVALNVAHDADELIFKQVRNNLKEISQKII
jgi:endonuclease III